MEEKEDMSDEALEILRAIHDDVDRMETVITRFITRFDEQITGIQTRKDNRMDEDEEIWKVELENRRLAAEHHREMLEWEHQQWLKNRC